MGSSTKQTEEKNTYQNEILFQKPNPKVQSFNPLQKEDEEILQENQGDRKDSSRKRYREQKKNKSVDQFRINKNLSISSFEELNKITKDIDNFKAYLGYQVENGNISLLSAKFSLITNVKKLFLVLGGHPGLSDAGISILSQPLSVLTSLNELLLDFSNSERITLHGINSLLDNIQMDSLEIFSVSVAKVHVGERDFDEFVDIIGNMHNLKSLSLSFQSCSLTSDDVYYLCEFAEDKEGLEKFKFYLSKNIISDQEAIDLEKKLSFVIGDTQIRQS